LVEVQATLPVTRNHNPRKTTTAGTIPLKQPATPLPSWYTLFSFVPGLNLEIRIPTRQSRHGRPQSPKIRLHIRLLLHSPRSNQRLLHTNRQSRHRSTTSPSQRTRTKFPILCSTTTISPARPRYFFFIRRHIRVQARAIASPKAPWRQLEDVRSVCISFGGNSSAYADRSPPRK